MEDKSEQERVRVFKSIEPAIAVEKLFVYGIFLDESTRDRYGMENPSYDTVPGYITVGNHIVSATKSDVYGVSLTGLLVDIPTRNLPSVDVLESGYARIIVDTSGGFEAFMYAAKGEEENYSSYNDYRSYIDYEYEHGQE